MLEINKFSLQMQYEIVRSNYAMKQNYQDASDIKQKPFDSQNLFLFAFAKWPFSVACILQSDAQCEAASKAEQSWTTTLHVTVKALKFKVSGAPNTPYRFNFNRRKQ